MRADFDFSVRQSVSRIGNASPATSSCCGPRGLSRPRTRSVAKISRVSWNALMGGSAASGVQLMASRPCCPRRAGPGHVAIQRPRRPDYTIRPGDGSGPVAPVTYIARRRPATGRPGHNIYADPLRR